MSLKTYGKIFLLCLSTVLLSHLARNYYERKKKKEEKKELHEVIMFSYRANGLIGLKRSKYSRCMVTDSMERLLYHLNCVRHTLDICMYVLTNMDISNALLKLHYRGVKIRIIVDADMAFSSGSSIKRFEKQGIQVRWIKSTNLMHHKFCLLDASVENCSDVQDVIPLVMMGSLNWTNSALSGNWEDVVVTSQEELVRQYKQEFEQLWILFKPVV